MSIIYKGKSDCCGCTACMAICPHCAIEMQPDKLGFLYPVVDAAKCVDCGLCDKVCQFNKGYKTYNNFEHPIIYGGRYKDIELLQSSQSGGAATAICDAFINDGGVVYGVCFDECFRVIHKKVTTIEGLSQLKGSKYVQSNLTGIFTNIKKDLVEGLKVLFIGTACQVAGLKSFIPSKFHDKLFCVDILCHASPSPALWESYLTYIKQKYSSDIISVNMRDKKYGWRSYHESFLLSNGKEIKRDSYIFLFFSHLSIRKSCEQCPFTNHKRVGDITLSDFWGWSKKHEEWNDDKGVSMLMVNNTKGRTLIEFLEDGFLLIESKEDEIDYLQPQLCNPSRANSLRDLFEEDFYRKGFRYVSYKYGDDNWKERIKKCIRPLYHFLINKLKNENRNFSV